MCVLGAIFQSKTGWSKSCQN